MPSLEDAVNAEISRRQLSEAVTAELSRREQKTQVGMLPGLGRAAAQGLTFGWADEAEAAVRALLREDGEDFEEAYSRNRDAIRQQVDAFRDQSPWAATGAEVGGAIAGAFLPGVGTAGAASKFVAGAPTLIGRLARLGAVGAIEGGIYGAGTAKEVEDILGGVASGAAAGAALGVAVPAAVEGVRGAGRLVRSAASPETGAAARLAVAAERSGDTPANLARKVQEARALGKPATLADVGGETMRRELETAVQRPGAGAQQAVEFLSQRNREQLSRLSRDIVGLTGVPADDVADVIATTMATREKAATPVYKAAMQFAAELNDDVVDAYGKVVATPLGKQALTKAKRILNVENFDDAPLMHRIDALKKGIDDVIETARRGGERNIARKATQIKRQLVDEVDAVNPTYRQAREIWEDGASYLDAIDNGREILKSNMTAAALKREWSGLADSEREAFRIGAVDAIVTRMRQQSAEEPNLLKIIRSPEISDKIKIMLSPRDAARFEKLIDIEEAMFKTSNQARGNSATQRRAASMDEQEKQVRLFGAIGMLLDSATGGLKSVLLGRLPSLTGAAKAAVLDKQSRLIVDQLLSTTPSATARTVSRIGGTPTPTPALASPAQTAAVPGAVAGSAAINE